MQNIAKSLSNVIDINNDQKARCLNCVVFSKRKSVDILVGNSGFVRLFDEFTKMLTGY